MSFACLRSQLLSKQERLPQREQRHRELTALSQPNLGGKMVAAWVEAGVQTADLMSNSPLIRKARLRDLHKSQQDL
jgi:hypothetical protein